MSSSSSSIKSHTELYGNCPNCDEIRFHYDWCRQCEFYSYQSEHPNWTSNSPSVNLVIQSIQANAGSIFSFIEWIEYDQFEKVEYISKGGFSSIFRATWKEGPRDGPPTFEEDEDTPEVKNNNHNDDENIMDNRVGNETRKNKMPKWKRRGHTAVILKSLTKSQDIKSRFFREFRVLSRCVPDEESYTVPGLLRVYGVTRNPQNQEYMLVLQYAEQDSLYEYLATQSYVPIDKTISILRSVARGLSVIHKSELIHGDLHGGNILIDATHCAYISDTGVSKPVDPSHLCNDSRSKGIFGVIPYTAPEVLLSGVRTKSSDIYSFGIIMCQLWSGQRPFVERAHDSQLCTDIYNGLRPRMVKDMSEKYREIVSWCLNASPANRPRIDELLRMIDELEEEFNLNDGCDGDNAEDEHLNKERRTWNEDVRKALYQERQTMRTNLNAKYFSRFISFLNNVDNVNDVNEYNKHRESDHSRNYIVKKVREISRYNCVMESITSKDEDFRKLIDWFYWAT